MDAVCVGETMVLLVPDPPKPPDLASAFRREIGGAESNVAIHLSRLGRRVCWHSAIGDDAFGRFVRARIADEEVVCDCVRVARGHRTGLYVKEFGPDGTTVAYYRDRSAATTLGPHDLAGVWRHQPRVVHTTGITAVLSESSRSLVAGLLESAPPDVLRSFDVNYRPTLHDEDAAERLLPLARQADIVFCGLDEAKALWGAQHPEDVRDLLAGVATVIVKHGAEGAVAFRGGRSWHQPAPSVDVVEPVGAGDAFAAGVLDGMLDLADLPDCLRRGARLAGEALQVDGDLPPRAARDHGREDGIAQVARDTERSSVPTR